MSSDHLPNDVNATPASPETDENADRRQFLTKSALLLTAFSLVQGSDIVPAFAQQLTDTQTRAVKAVLSEGAKTGNVKKALATQGKDLPDSVKRELSALSASDLRAINQLQSKLRGLDARLKDNNGVVIM